MEATSFDLQLNADDQINARIEKEFTGHGMAALVEAILLTRGIVTWLSPDGPDGGIVYDRLPGEIRARLPLKQIWVLATDERQ